MEPADLQQLAVRRRIVAEVVAFPGLHLRELARRLDTSVARIEYHVPLLVEAGLLEEVRTVGLLRFFPGPAAAGGRATSPSEWGILALLRDRLVLGIVLAILDAPAPMRHRDLAQRLG